MKNSSETQKLLRDLDLNPFPTGPVITIPHAFEGEQTLHRLLGFLDKVLWQNVCVIVCVHEDTPEVLDLELYMRKYPNRCAVVRQPAEAVLAEYLKNSDIAIFPGAKEDLPPRHLELALTSGVSCVVYANLIARQDIARLEEEQGITAPVFLFYLKTREALWDAAWAAICSLKPASAEKV